MTADLEMLGAPEGFPTTNPVAVMLRAGEIVMAERAVPHPGPGQVLVEVRAVGVCGSDIHYFTEGRIGSFVVEAPLVLGHEASGVVIARGVGATRLEVGQRVALEPGVPCKRCRACRSGRYNLCPDIRFFATPPVDGAFARYVVHDEDFAHPIPESLSYDEGALIEPLSVALWACWKASIAVGDRVLVTGAGPIGLLVAAVARSSGASEVIVTDIDADRLDLALRLGATSVLAATRDSAQDLDGLDRLIECSGNAAAMDDGLRSLRPGGRAVLVGMSPDTHVALPVSLIQTREVEVTGTFRYANTYPSAIRLVASGAVRVAALVSGHYGLDEVASALRAPSLDRSAVKPIVVPTSSGQA